MKVDGVDMRSLIDANPLFDTSIFYRVTEKITSAEKGAFVKGCMMVNVDPEIVERQAMLIAELQKALEIAMGDALKICAPSFRQYDEVVKENEKLKATLNEIKNLLDEEI